MYCEDCGSITALRLAEYVDRKEKLGVVLCYQCRRGTPAPQVLDPFPAM